MTISKDVFCPMPFVALDISSSGEVSYCCESQFKLPQSTALHLQELFGHEAFCEDRTLFNRGAIPIGCANCFKKELQGLTSKRKTEILNFNLGLFGSPNLDLTTGELRFFSYRVGNNCNLTCIMCNSESSYKIGLEDWKSDLSKNTPPPVLHSNKIDYDSSLNSIKLLYVGGGEPLRSKEFKDLLDHLINIDKNDITVSFNTNLSSLPKSYIKALKNFESVYFSVSIDGYKESLEYIRYPLKWDLLKRNLKELQKIDKFRCGIHFTVSALNIPCLPRLLKELANSWFGTLPLEFHAPILYHPNEQSLEVLSDSALRKYRTLLHDCSEYIEKFENLKLGYSIDNLLHYIDLTLEKNGLNGEQKNEYRNRLIRQLEIKDKIRGTNFKKAFPNLKVDLQI